MVDASKHVKVPLQSHDRPNEVSELHAGSHRRGRDDNEPEEGASRARRHGCGRDRSWRRSARRWWTTWGQGGSWRSDALRAQPAGDVESRRRRLRMRWSRGARRSRGGTGKEGILRETHSWRGTWRAGGTSSQRRFADATEQRRNTQRAGDVESHQRELAEALADATEQRREGEGGILRAERAAGGGRGEPAVLADATEQRRTAEERSTGEGGGHFGGADPGGECSAVRAGKTKAYIDATDPSGFGNAVPLVVLGRDPLGSSRHGRGRGTCVRACRRAEDEGGTAGDDGATGRRAGCVGRKLSGGPIRRAHLLREQGGSPTRPVGTTMSPAETTMTTMSPPADFFY
ncbi:hypothetical protein C8F04DRAFT_1192942 [Mycena alexandri]|uniref:Uncharacterized protein n=1 Tax=Mycena alexandri TaxID=1745969 RepID=A0AAD6WUH3_9AGAR|nr:hypothetical protein C8F04DRAFT_1192942 [Mycena alexandri]